MEKVAHLEGKGNSVGVLNLGGGFSVGTPYGIKNNLGPTKFGAEVRKFNFLNALDGRKMSFTTQISQRGSWPHSLVDVPSRW